MKRFALLLLLLCTWLYVGAQEIVTVSGRVLNSTNGKPLGYASLTLVGTSISNITNKDGYFTLKLPSSHLKDSVLISYLGFKNLKVAVKDNLKEPQNILLEPSIEQLNPIIVRPHDPLSIVKLALARIPKNFPTKQEQMTTFYREMIQKGSRYVSINEAVIDITKAPYLGFRNDQLSLYKARGNWDVKRADTLVIKFQGGPNSALEIDLVKDPFLAVDPFLISKIYHFTLLPPITIDDRLFYVIEFDQHKSVSDIYFRGKLYIDPETFAIGRAHFWMNVENKKEAAKLFVLKKPATLKMDILSAEYLVNYKLADSLWHFDYSHTELKFSTKWNKKLFKSNYTVSSEIAVTDRSNIIRKVDSQKRIKPRDIISTRVSDFTDEQFWEEYNIIEPESSIEKIISRIIKQLEKREKEN